MKKTIEVPIQVLVKLSGYALAGSAATVECHGKLYGISFSPSGDAVISAPISFTWKEVVLGEKFLLTKEGVLEYARVIKEMKGKDKGRWWNMNGVDAKGRWGGPTVTFSSPEEAKDHALKMVLFYEDNPSR